MDMRIGAVNYLNSKPLVYGLEALAPEVRLSFDLPSRLADSLAAGRLDVALIPSVELFRSPGNAVVSDACVACRGPVLSVKLHFRVPPRDVRSVALDEGSRTSAALARILLAELYGLRPRLESLALGCGLATTDADAVLLIGDRAIADWQKPGSDNPKSEIRNPKLDEGQVPEIVETWDLGQRWTQWTSLPFVFAMWVGRDGIKSEGVSAVLNAARDGGLQHVDEIAEREGPLVSVSPELARQYFRENLHFVLGEEELAGLQRFYELCVAHGIAPDGGEERLAVQRRSASLR
jgi:chorismate dehydratase